MIFSTLEHISTHISFSTVFVVITLHLMTLLVNEIVGLYKSLEKGIEKFFKCNNCAKCYFYPSICYVGPLNSNASICNISTCSPISMVNDACKYDGIGLCGSFMRIIIISNTSNYYISKRYNKDF
ncbi:Cytochrome c biogenesis protein CcsA [Bienertia sinuspersici]